MFCVANNFITTYKRCKNLYRHSHDLGILSQICLCKCEHVGVCGLLPSYIIRERERELEREYESIFESSSNSLKFVKAKIKSASAKYFEWLCTLESELWMNEWNELNGQVAFINLLRALSTKYTCQVWLKWIGRSKKGKNSDGNGNKKLFYRFFCNSC